MSQLKRKAHLSALTPQLSKKIHLDPAAVPTDTAIAEREGNISENLSDDHDMTIPFGAELKETGATLKEMGATLKEMLECMDRKWAEKDKRRLNWCIADALVALTKKLASDHKRVFCPECSSIGLQQFAMTITAQQFASSKVPTKLQPYIKNLSQYVSDRNMQAYMQAYETGGELAQLLLPWKDGKRCVYERWKLLFPLLFEGASVEEIAAREEAEFDELSRLLETA